jgi:hypothetical protein
MSAERPASRLPMAAWTMKAADGSCKQRKQSDPRSKCPRDSKENRRFRHNQA